MVIAELQSSGLIVTHIQEVLFNSWHYKWDIDDHDFQPKVVWNKVGNGTQNSGAVQSTYIVLWTVTAINRILNLKFVEIKLVIAELGCDTVYTEGVESAYVSEYFAGDHNGEERPRTGFMHRIL